MVRLNCRIGLAGVGNRRRSGISALGNLGQPLPGGVGRPPRWRSTPGRRILSTTGVPSGKARAVYLSQGRGGARFRVQVPEHGFRGAAQIFGQPGDGGSSKATKGT